MTESKKVISDVQMKCGIDNRIIVSASITQNNPNVDIIPALDELGSIGFAVTNVRLSMYGARTRLVNVFSLIFERPLGYKKHPKERALLMAISDLRGIGYVFKGVSIEEDDDEQLLQEAKAEAILQATEETPTDETAN